MVNYSSLRIGRFNHPPVPDTRFHCELGILNRLIDSENVSS